MSALESCIRENLNINAKRVMAVLHPLKLIIDNYGQEGVDAASFEVPNHPDRPELGTRKVSFGKELYIDASDFRETANKQYKRLKLNSEVRLRHAYIIKAVSCEKDAEGNVTVVHAEAIPNSVGANVEGHKPKGVIHFVNANDCLRAQVNIYSNLFNVPNPAASEDFLSTINPNSCQVITDAAVESSLKDAQVLESFQFEREGYFCVDSRNSLPQKPVFNLTVALRDTNKTAV